MVKIVQHALIMFDCLLEPKVIFYAYVSKFESKFDFCNTKKFSIDIFKKLCYNQLA